MVDSHQTANQALRGWGAERCTDRRDCSGGDTSLSTPFRVFPLLIQVVAERGALGLPGDDDGALSVRLTDFNGFGECPGRRSDEQ